MFSLLTSASTAALGLAAASGAAPLAPLDPSADQIVVYGTYTEQEITVATKTPTLLIDVPQSVSVISEAQIDEQAFFSMGDISRFTPGVSIGQGEGHRDQITIRGQNTTADFFIDGLRDDVQYYRPLYNVESVEVLRGSNALIFGRGGGGGVINRTTKTPDADDEFMRSMVSADTFGSVYADADLNRPVGENAAFRLNAFAEHLENHRDVFEGDRFGINPTFGAELGSATDLVLSYEYLDDERVVDRGVPSLGGRPLRGFDETFFGDPDINTTTLQAHIARARLDHSFSQNWSGNVTLQYADYDKLYQNLYPIGIDLTAPSVSLDGYRDTTERENLILQGNLVGQFTTGPVGHTLLLGAEYADQETENARQDAFFADSQDDQITFLFTDPLSVPAVGFPVSSRDRASAVDVTSFYIQDQVDLGEHVKIVGGARYDRFEIDVLDAIDRQAGNDGRFSRTDEEWSPRLGVILKPVENVSVYGSYSKSFLPRAGDQFLTLDLTSEALGPEEFENHEIGVKWDLRPNLSFTGALFRLDRDSGTTIDPRDPERTVLIGSRTEGVELQLTGAVTSRLSVIAGYSYLDAEERGRFDGAELANRRLAQVPEHMVSLWSRFEATDRLGLSLGVSHQAEQFATIGNNVELPAFTRVDAAADYRVNDRFAVQLNVENLLDEEYFPDAHNANNISTGEPLNARLTLRTAF